jgi:hypothetical protein
VCVCVCVCVCVLCVRACLCVVNVYTIGCLLASLRSARDCRNNQLGQRGVVAAHRQLERDVLVVRQSCACKDIAAAHIHTLEKARARARACGEYTHVGEIQTENK